ncbi:MAG: transcription elongation factor GreB [Myxococcales bacterium]|nr:transcription elongation factor GreB [Myxococcales bacterium]
MSNRKPITPEGYAKLEKELNQLWHHERPRVVQEVSEAAALGDRSENAEYIYGKKRLREIDRKVKYLSGLLDRLDVIDPSQVTSDTVEFGATVEVEDEDGRVLTYQIVGEDEVDARNKRISMRSPVGQSLVGKRVGDDVLVRRPAGEIELVVTKICYR